MRWSKLRSLVKERFARELVGRLDINSTAYGACSCGHAWLTWDGNVIANFCTRAKYNANGCEDRSEKPNPMYADQFAEYGEFSRQDAYEACWAFIHDLSIEEALIDDDPLVTMLALADGRIGKRRLAKMERDTFHPLAAKVLDLRQAA
tara:strand:+ start:242 stop:685 length:444 start_codon:yes stop_codon:yes gene_type:complete